MASEIRRSADHRAAPDPEQAEDEVRMRRALGLGSSGKQASSRASGAPVVVHRNGRTGEAPVNRLAELQAALAAERTARERAETSLRAAETALHESETRRGHAELTRDEALATLAVERQARAAAEDQLRSLTSSQPVVAVAPMKRGRPAGATKASPPQSSDAPVEWWLPGWKERFGSKG